MSETHFRNNNSITELNSSSISFDKINESNLVNITKKTDPSFQAENTVKILLILCIILIAVLYLLFYFDFCRICQELISSKSKLTENSDSKEELLCKEILNDPGEIIEIVDETEISRSQIDNKSNEKKCYNSLQENSNDCETDQIRKYDDYTEFDLTTKNGMLQIHNVDT